MFGDGSIRPLQTPKHGNIVMYRKTEQNTDGIFKCFRRVIDQYRACVTDTRQYTLFLWPLRRLGLSTIGQ